MTKRPTVALKTPLFDLHKQLGARLIDFAHYQLPVQYSGIIDEHLHTRQHAGLFDVSHMGQIVLKSSHYQHCATVLESITPTCFQSLMPGQQRYGVLLNAQGGIIDDFMAYRGVATKDADESNWLFVVLNASRKYLGISLITTALTTDVKLEELQQQALIALQGPQAIEVLAPLHIALRSLTFLQATRVNLLNTPCRVSRSGYTGEDGFEISLAADAADAFYRQLLQHELVKPCGLGARDSLRIEAGLPLYGQELSESVTPIDAGLNFVISKARRQKADFPAAERLLAELANAPTYRHVGLLLQTKMPARSGAKVILAGEVIGEVTSGVFSPSLQKPIALARINRQSIIASLPLQSVQIEVRSKLLRAHITALPFVPHNYHR